MTQLIDLAKRGDARGSLVVIDDRDVGFEVKRVYYVVGTSPGVARGFHAHFALNQFAVAVAGSCTFILDDGQVRETVRLDDPARGLPLPAMIWHEMADFSPDCVLLMLASAHYDEADYIRDYDRFEAAVAARRADSPC